jgi:serine-type D-Ala-D-Ala carboxypeptidase (penicillin-binding protein 5/6)
MGLKCKHKVSFYVIAWFIWLVSFYPSVIHADEINAKAAVVIDSQTGEIYYAKNPDHKLPPASLTKLVTAMVVLDNVSPETMVTVSKHAESIPSVAPKIEAGERYAVEDLLYLSLMRSVNSAAVTLAEGMSGSEEAFVQAMNRKVRDIGVLNTYFINASGLPGDGQYTTASDMAKIMKAALGYPLLAEILNTKVKLIRSADGRPLFLKNTNQLLWKDRDVIAGKTGYTRAAGHCFVSVAQRDGRLLIVAILGHTKRDTLWDDTVSLLARVNDFTYAKAKYSMLPYSEGIRLISQ